MTNQIDPAVRAMQRAAELAPEVGAYRLRLGVAYSETGHYEEGVTELLAATKQLPRSVDGWQALALCYQRLQKFLEARDAYKAALDLNPTNTDLSNSYGYMLVNTREADAGIAEFRKVLVQDPANIGVQVNIGFAYIQKGEIENAIKQLTKVTQTQAWN